MKVGASIHQGRISPLFDVTRSLVVLEVAHGREVGRWQTPLDNGGEAARARQVAAVGVEVLICGAISRPLEAMLASMGVQVVPNICGPVDEVLAAYISGDLEHDAYLMPGCRGRRRRHRGRHRHRGGGPQGPRR